VKRRHALQATLVTALPAMVSAQANALTVAGRRRQGQAGAGLARSALCALAAPGFELRGKSLAERLLDADVEIGISTPKADPSGDYAFEMFERIENNGVAARPMSASPIAPMPRSRARKCRSCKHCRCPTHQCLCELRTHRHFLAPG
jgi:Bacterial extracellular solute-binding protein